MEGIKEKIGFIINPVSGRGNKNRIPQLIDTYLDKESFDSKIVVTQKAGHASLITKEMVLNDYSKVVAVGGDGTVNEVAKALIHTDSALGIIPTGSGNGLARHLNIPMNCKKSIKDINSSIIKKIDFGLVNDIPFFCTCGLGFDAHISKVFAEGGKRGFSGYIRNTLKEFITYRPREYNLLIDGQPLKQKAFLITFANGSQYGNNAYIAPQASISDGKLDICILSHFPWYKTPLIGVSLFLKTLPKSKYYRSFHCEEVYLERQNIEAVHYDGEPIELGNKIHIKIVKSGLNVMIRGGHIC